MTRESPLRILHRLGQSPWLDFLSRDLVQSGELARLIESRGLRGVTSNPAIFHKAVSSGRTYDDDIRALAGRGLDLRTIFEHLAIEDVSAAAERLRKVYQESEGRDGFVSLEVSPHLAYDATATVEEAKRLWNELGHPNVMIKVPATTPGVTAICDLLAEGINVNVTLLFDLGRYRAVAEAFLQGLEERASAGRPLDRVASVASFFLSRIDTLADQRLDDLEGSDSGEVEKRLRGEVAIACARRAYATFGEVFGSERFARLRREGARVQRLLWASTGTKDPVYSDVKYVEPLIARDTVNTLPLETLEAYHEHGEPAPRLERDDGGHAEQVLAELAALGIDLSDLTDELLEQGVQKFIQPYDLLLESIAQVARS